jgi:hypothetical protein
MSIINLESLWGYLLFLASYYIYEKFLRNTVFKKMGKLFSLLLFFGAVLLLNLFKVNNEYLYQLFKTVPAFFVFNLFNKKDGGKKSE